jgi:hypothetical protein
MTLCCNLCLLSAIAAGRAETGSLTWGLCSYAQPALVAVAFVAAARGTTEAWQGETTTLTFVFAFAALVSGSLISLGLAYVEYAALGRRSSFRADLGGAFWFWQMKQLY